MTIRDQMYMPKKPCPRDLGYWYCDECLEKHLDEQSWVDFPIPMESCGRAFGDKVCGETHLGYDYCGECKAAGAEEIDGWEKLHIGEFEVVAVI